MKAVIKVFFFLFKVFNSHWPQEVVGIGPKFVLSLNILTLN